MPVTVTSSVKIKLCEKMEHSNKIKPKTVSVLNSEGILF